MSYDLAKALQAFADRGISLDDETMTSVKAELDKEFRKATVGEVAKRLADENLTAKQKTAAAEKWTAELFSLAEKMNRDLRSVERAQGRGFVRVTNMTDIETPHGRLSIKLSETISEPTEK